MGSLLIKNGYIITMDNDFKVFKGDIFVENGVIKEVKSKRKKADEVIDAENNWVLPGFVQAHIHLCQTLMRGLADDMNVVDWLRERIWPLEKAHNPSSLYYSAMLSIAELLKNGTTSILTMETTNHTDSVFEAIRDAGIRAKSGKAIMDYKESGTEMDPEDTETSIKEIERLINRWHNTQGGLIQYALNPRGPRNCTEKMMNYISKQSKEIGLTIHSHAAENGSLTNKVVKRTKIRDIELFKKWDCTSPRLVLAHCIWLNSSETSILRETGTNVVHCPSANLKLASGIAKIPEMLKEKINVSLGADGAPCNNNLNIFNEMRIASLIHKPRCGESSMSAREILRMAINGGVKAMNLEENIGEIIPGKKADLVILKRDALHGSPYSKVSPESQIVYSLEAQDVISTIVNGKILVRDRELTFINENDLKERANIETENLLKRAKLKG